MQTVIKSVWLGTSGNGMDISEYISSLKYRRGIDKDNSLEFIAESANAEYLLSLADFYPNKIITFSFGYMGGKVSAPYVVVITDIEPTYRRSGLRLSVRCLDKGTTLKKVTSARVWKKKSTPEIVNEVAKMHGLKAEVVPVDSSLSGNPQSQFRQWDSLPQANMNNMELLQHLADNEAGAEYIVYADNDTIHFKPIGTGSESRRVYDIKDTTEVEQFAMKYRETTIPGEVGIGKADLKAKKHGVKINANHLAALQNSSFLGQSVLFAQNAVMYAKKNGENVPIRGLGTAIDATTGAMRDLTLVAPPWATDANKPVADVVSKVQPTKSAKTAQPSGKGSSSLVKTVVDGVKDFTGAVSDLKEGLADDYTMGETYTAPSAMMAEDALAVARRKHHRNTRKLLTASLRLFGDPTMKLDTVITVTGIAERFIGNWYIESITDDLSMNGYVTELELSKNAVKTTKNPLKARKVNDKPNTKKDTVRIKVTDGTIYNNDRVIAPGYQPKGTISNRNR